MRGKDDVLRKIPRQIRMRRDAVEPIGIQHNGNIGIGQNRFKQIFHIRLLRQPRPCNDHIRPGTLFFQDRLHFFLLLRIITAHHSFRKLHLQNLPVLLHRQDLHQTGAASVRTEGRKISRSAHPPAACKDQHLSKGSFISIRTTFRKFEKIFFCDQACVPSCLFKTDLRKTDICHL